MWIAKFKIKHDDWILDKTLKYNVTARGVPLNAYQKKGKYYHTGMVFLSGSYNDKQKFIGSVEQDKRVHNCEVRGNTMFVLIEGKDMISQVFDKSLFFIQPVLMKEGFEYWELGSWEKKPLIAFFNRVKKIAQVEMIKLIQEFPAAFIQHALPNLTEKQQVVIELALEAGYYEYPRKVSIQELARQARIPRTTLQEHLRKAEKRVMRVLLNSV